MTFTFIFCGFKENVLMLSCRSRSIFCCYFKSLKYQVHLQNDDNASGHLHGGKSCLTHTPVWLFVSSLSCLFQIWEREREKNICLQKELCNFQTLILLYNRAAVISWLTDNLKQSKGKIGNKSLTSVSFQVRMSNICWFPLFKCKNYLRLWISDCWLHNLKTWNVKIIIRLINNKNNSIDSCSPTSKI